MQLNETFADRAIQFHKNLNFDLPDSDVDVMNPFTDENVLNLVSAFFRKYFDDNNDRTFLFGINPGRFGAGITGIAFTDPVNLEEKCRIENDFDKKHELSSQFIYEVIDAWGGAEAFYKRFFVTAISPLGFVKNGKNINYYDEKPLQKAVEPFIRKTMNRQLEIGAKRKSAVCIGGGKNFKFFDRLNDEMKIFEQIIPLDHPRFVMQYRRKSKDQYVKKYLDGLNFCESLNNF